MSEAWTLPRGCGELADLVRTYDWSRTSLGPLADWPQCLIFAVRTLLLSPVPIVLLWGEDGIMIYNDAYSGFAGGRHPQLLGSKVREGWPEVADFNDNVMRVGLAGGTLSYRDQELTLHRYGAARAGLDEPRLFAGLRRERAARRGHRHRGREHRAGAGRAAPARERGAVPHPRPGHPAARLARRDRRGLHLVEPAMAGLYRADRRRRASASAGWRRSIPRIRGRPGPRGSAAAASGHLSYEHRLSNAAERRYCWFQTRAAAVRDAQGRIVEWLGTSTDIDDLRQLQERQQVMVAELQHRTRNLLGVVRAIAKQTMA